MSLNNIGRKRGENKKREGKEGEKLKMDPKNDVPRFRKRSRKRRSFMETEHTSLVTFPEKGRTKKHNQIPNHCSGPRHLTGSRFGEPSNQTSCSTASSLTDAKVKPAQLESLSITSSKQNGSGANYFLHGSKISKTNQQKQQVILMEPDSMEFKSVTAIMSAASPAIVAIRTSTEPKVKCNIMSSADGLKEEGGVGGLAERLLDGHLFFSTPNRDYADDALPMKTNDQKSLIEGPYQEPLHRKKSCSCPQLDIASSPLSLKVLTQSLSQNTGMDRLDVDNLAMEIQECSIEPTERARSLSMSAGSNIGGHFCLMRHLLPQTKPVLCKKGPQSCDTGCAGNPFTQELTSTVSLGQLTQGNVFSSSGIPGRLSASPLQGKMQTLPPYLSRSQEVLTTNCSLADNDKPARSFSEDMTTTRVMSEEVVMEVDEEFEEVVCSNSYVEQVEKAEPEELPWSAKSPSVDPIKISPSSLVVTTQNLNSLWGVVRSQETAQIVLTNCDSKPTNTQPQGLSGSNLHAMPDLTCGSVLASVCETVIESVETPMEICGCQSAYTNCFTNVLDSGSFDDELTVYEFSCRTQPSMRDRVALVTSIPPSSLSGSSSSFSPSSPLPAFSRVVLPPSSSAELGPLLSPLDTPDCFLSDPHGDAIASLLAQHYPLPATGFLALQRDVDTLQTILEGAKKDQDCFQEHPRDICADHFSENKRRLHVEARAFLAGCQKVVKSGQTPAETLQALADSFRSLVQLTAVCLSFSSCPRCQERHCQTLLRLADVSQTYQEFARAAERLGMATERRTCHELSIKLLARQCTALTTSVFCLTQLFRTLTSL